MTVVDNNTAECLYSEWLSLLVKLTSLNLSNNLIENELANITSNLINLTLLNLILVNNYIDNFD